MGRDGERSDEELVLGAVGSRLVLERGCSVRPIAMTGCTILFEKEILAICFLRDGWEDEDEDAGLKDG